VKVAILGARGIPARYGGFETFAEKLAVGLAERGFQMTVFCEGREGQPPARFHGVELRYHSAPALGPLQTIAYDLKCLWSARRGFDVVYMLGYGVAPFCALPRLWRTTVWINPDGVEWARAKWNAFAKLYFRCMEWFAVRAASRVLADAEAIAAHLERRHGPLRACSVIPYGCEIVKVPPDAAMLRNRGLEAYDYFLVVCRLEPENHVLEILEAFRKSHSKRQLVIVGNNQVSTPYVKQLRSVRDPRIRMIGTVYDAPLLTTLRSCAFAYLHGHSVGGTNPSLLEAMGCANLILAHDNAFNRETLGDEGLYFRTTEDLAATINAVESRPEDLERLRVGARERATARYNWSDVIDRYAELLRQEADTPDGGKSKACQPKT
jgi:glycosyltransferase involved in cell wall biosynthesis